MISVYLVLISKCMILSVCNLLSSSDSNTKTFDPYLWVL